MFTNSWQQPGVTGGRPLFWRRFRNVTLRGWTMGNLQG